VSLQHVQAAWICSVDMDMQLGHGHAAWTWRMDIYIDMEIEMDMDLNKENEMDKEMDMDLEIHHYWIDKLGRFLKQQISVPLHFVFQRALNKLIPQSQLSCLSLLKPVLLNLKYCMMSLQI
jgi:hypothetical protein